MGGWVGGGGGGGGGRVTNNKQFTFLCRTQKELINHRESEDSSSWIQFYPRVLPYEKLQQSVAQILNLHQTMCFQ